MQKLYLHIGYSKTGTTTLQNYFFKIHEDINYLGRPYKNRNLEKIIFELKSLNKRQFHLKRYKISKELNNLNLKKNKTNLISEENLTGIFGFYSHNLYELTERYLSILRKRYDLKIVIIIRNQPDWIISRYSNFQDNFYRISKEFIKIDYLFKLMNKTNKTKKEKNLLKNIDYYKFIKFLNKKCGKRNVKVLYYESLKLNKDKFVKDLSKFLNIDIRKSKKLLIKSTNISLKNKDTYIVKKNYVPSKKIYKNKITLFLSKFLPKKIKKIVRIIIHYLINFFLKIQMHLLKEKIYFSEYDKKKILKYFKSNKKFINNKNIQKYYI